MPSDALRLYHYTCDHGRDLIGDEGCLRPLRDMQTGPGLTPFSAAFVWLTDLDVPVRDALGLTSNILSCDRTRHRYRVIAGQYGVAPWTKVRRAYVGTWVEALESAPGAIPMHWWVSSHPVAVIYDPVSGNRHERDVR